MNFVSILIGFVAISQAFVLTPGMFQKLKIYLKSFSDFDTGAVYGKRTWPYVEKKWYWNHINAYFLAFFLLDKIFQLLV